jgi:hypothetical protein
MGTKSRTKMEAHHDTPQARTFVLGQRRANFAELIGDMRISCPIKRLHELHPPPPLITFPVVS